MRHSHLVGGVGRLGHAVTPFDGIVKLLVHGQLGVRGATCQGAKTRERYTGSGVLKSGEKPSCQGWVEGKVILGLRNVAASWLWVYRDPPQSQAPDVTVQTPGPSGGGVKRYREGKSLAKDTQQSWDLNLSPDHCPRVCSRPPPPQAGGVSARGGCPARLLRTVGRRRHTQGEDLPE